MESNLCFKLIELRQQIKLQLHFTDYKTPCEFSWAAVLMTHNEHPFHF